MEDEDWIDAPKDPVLETEERVGDEGDVARDRDDPQRDHRLHEERREHEERGKPRCDDDQHWYLAPTSIPTTRPAGDLPAGWPKPDVHVVLVPRVGDDDSRRPVESG